MVCFMQVLCISGYLGCSHSDSCCWNPVKLWLWHSALVVPAYSGNAIMIPPTSWRNLPISWIVFSPALSLPLFSYAAAPVSMPSLRRQYPWIRKSSPTSLPLSSACPPHLWPHPRAETRPARPTSCKATLSGCRHYRPSAVTISRFI